LDNEYELGVRYGRPGGTSSRRPSVGGAVLLSFVWPGLGQLYAGRRRRALIFALPALLLVGGALIAVARSPEVFALRLLVPSFAYFMIALIVVHAAWRVAAIVDASAVARRARGVAGRALPLVLMLSLVVVGSHAAAGYFVYSFAGAGERIFGGNGPPPDRPNDPLDEVLRPVPVQPLPGQPTPSPRPVNAIPRDQPINILFVGVDSGPGRAHALTDTLIVASYDPLANEIVMISVPRDTARIPMFDGTTYDNRINTLMGHFRRNPERYPDGPVDTLVRQMGYLIGIPIHYYAVTDMTGLREVVDLVGGVDVELDRAIRDSRMGLFLEPGTHHLDGERTLMFVRSRYGPGNNDFVRARRQQAVIRALAQRVREPAVLVRLPEVLDAGANLVRSDVPVEQLPEILDLLQRSEDASTTQIVLAPRRYAERIPPAEVGGRYMIQLKMDAVAALSVELFGGRSRYASQDRLPEPIVDPDASPR
jgi:polyisoprenyl-teichoic acid--peptidoglycan teichoic acid transferase